MFKRSILLAAVLWFLVSCSSPEIFQFFLEPYTWEILNNQGVDRQELKQLLKAHGCRLQLMTAQPEASAREILIGLLGETRPDFLYISPLFPFDMSEIIALFPKTLFFLEASPEKSAFGNLIQIEFRREKAFYEAGRRAGRLLNSRSFKDYLEKSSNFESLKAGILVSELNDTGSRQIHAFREGFEETALISDLTSKEIGNLTDRVKARRLLEKMKEDGVVIILLKTYNLTGFCLEFLQKEGGLAIVEDWAASGGYEDVVLMSIEDNLFGAIGNALDLLLKEDGALSRQGMVVSGPVRLEWGKIQVEAGFEH